MQNIKEVQVITAPGHAACAELLNELLKKMGPTFTIAKLAGPIRTHQGDTEHFASVTVSFYTYLSTKEEESIGELVEREVPEIIEEFKKSRPELLLNIFGNSKDVGEISALEAMAIEAFGQAVTIAFLARNPQFTNSFVKPQPVKVIKAKKTATKIKAKAGKK